MADIGDEVAPRGFHPSLLGLVVDVDDGEPAVVLGQQPDVATHRQPRAAARRPAARREVYLDVFAGGQGALGRQPCPVVEQTVTHQAQFLGPVVGVDDVPVGVDHDDAHRRHRHDVCSICETVIPDCSAARRCLRSTILGVRLSPTPTPITRASRATTAVSSSADTTLTSK